MRILTIIIGLCFTVSTFSQNYKFGKVSKEELEETVCPIDSTASAAYLYKYRKTFFEYQKEEGFQLITEIHERIKIYNQEGFDYATKEVLIYDNGSKREKMLGLKAYTYNLLDTKVEISKLGKEGVFNSELNKYYNQEKFTMPNIKEGCIVEFKYRITSPFFWNVDDFVFQRDIPVKKLEAIFETPEYYNFKVNAKGFLTLVPHVEKKRDKISYRSSAGIQGRASGNPRVAYNEGEVEFQKNISTYSLENIPALKNEPYANNIDNYRASIKYELSYEKFPNSPIKYYSTTWEDVVKTIYESSSFGEELKKTAYFQKDIDALIGGVSDPIKRVGLIFNFVKSQVKWNGYYGYYSGDGVRKAYKDHVGNIGDINLMLTAMLRYVGLNANPVLVSTRHHGVPLFPTREGYNYVVTWVKLSDGTIMLLDATNKYTVPNILPFRTLNWQGRIIAKSGNSELVDLYSKTQSKNAISMMVNINDEGTLEGSYRSVKTNHNALSFRNSYNDRDKDDFLEKLENKYNGIKISDYEV